MTQLINIIVSMVGRWMMATVANPLGAVSTLLTDDGTTITAGYDPLISSFYKFKVNRLPDGIFPLPLPYSPQKK